MGNNKTISFDRELALKLKVELWELMNQYYGEDYQARDEWVCSFCGRSRYSGDGKNMEHREDCLGLALEKELDEKLG